MGRKKGSKNRLKTKTSKDLRKYAQEKTEESGIYERRSYLHLVCNVCKREVTIRVNNKSIYSKEYIKNYICLLCRPSKRRQ